MTTLDELAKALQVANRQRRVDGNIVAIAGARGLIKLASDGVPTVTLMHQADYWLRRDLVDAGVISRVYGTDVYRLRRIPDGPEERQAFRSLVGLTREKESAA